MNSKQKEHNQNAASINEIQFGQGGFEAFFKRHYPQLCVYCKFKFGIDIEVAEDVVNTSFSKLWEVREMLDANASATSYLYKIVNNTCLNLVKHEKVKKRYAQEYLRTTSVILDSSFETMDLKRLRSDIDAAIAELPPQMRRIFELSRFEGLKYAQIGTHLNISVKTVETQMGRALSRLRQRLSAYLTLFFTALFIGVFKF